MFRIILVFFLLLSNLSFFAQDKNQPQKKLIYSKIYQQFPDIAKIIIEESQKQNIDPILTASIIFVESRGRKKHIGKSGEIGLMQIMPYHFKHLPKMEDYFAPSINIKVGLKFLQFCMKLKKKLKAAISCYNTGPNKSGINQKYVKKVFTKYDQLRQK